MAKQKVKFLVGRTVANPEGKDDIFEAGKTYDLVQSSADRWVRRGVAEYASNNTRTKADDSTSGGTGSSK